MSKKETVDLVLRLPPDLHKRCKELARQRGWSINRFIVETIAAFEAGEELPESAEERLTRRIEKLEKTVYGDIQE